MKLNDKINKLKEGGFTMRFTQKMFVVVLMLLLPVSTVFAQTDKGDWEFSVAGSFMSMKIEGVDESFASIRLAGRAGYFITKCFEIEPEIILGKIDEDLFGEAKWGYIFSCNLAYHFSTSSKTVPFVLAGVGISNTFPIFAKVVIFGSEDETWKLINAGAGIKVFLSKAVALRVEYRFQHYFGEKGMDNDFTCHFGMIGVSVFLK